MGYALTALQAALAQLRAHPRAYFGSAAVITLGNLLVNLIPFIGGLLALIVVPYLTAGLYGYLTTFREHGRSSVGTFTTAGSDYYGPILGANLLLAFVFGIGFALLVAIGLVTTGLGAGPGVPTNPLHGDFGLFLVVVVVLGAIAVAATQFFALAIVRDDLGPVEGLIHSIGLFITHPVSVLSFCVLTGVVALGLYMLPVGVLAGLDMLGGSSPGQLVLTPVYLLTTILTSGFGYAYQIEVYELLKQNG